ncbi:uncharacterized protein LOC144625639 [Crassostrea virginica]
MAMFTCLQDCFMLILINSLLYGNAGGCIETIATIEIVQGCPQTQQVWTEAAVRKNCGGITNSCSSFVYHCVMNTWRNETVEVCAQTRLIVGKKCAEYNYLGILVQRNEKVNCRKCPNVYNSSQSYHYLECYQYVTATPDPLPVTEPEVTTSSFLSHNDETTTIRTSSPNSSVTQGGGTTENQPDNVDMRIIIPLSIAGGMLLVTPLILIVLVRYKKRNDKCKNIRYEEEELEKL